MKSDTTIDGWCWYGLCETKENENAEGRKVED